MRAQTISARTTRGRAAANGANMSAIPPSYAPDAANGNENQSSRVSWTAILVGALVAAAMGLTLTAAGARFRLASISPWTHIVANGDIRWMVAVQAFSAVVGGYVAGRLRTKWVTGHSDEVYLRDTAHGFAVWVVSVTLTAALLASASTSALDGAGHLAVRAATVSARVRPTAIDSSGLSSYYVDVLLRSPRPALDGNDTALRDELARILTNGAHDGALSSADQTYLTQIVATRTGLLKPEAAQRVSTVIAEAGAAARADESAHEAANAARRTAEHSAYWLFAGLVLGAFLSSLAATIGGRQRDRVQKMPLPYTLT